MLLLGKESIFPCGGSLLRLEVGLCRHGENVCPVEGIPSHIACGGELGEPVYGGMLAGFSGDIELCRNETPVAPRVGVGNAYRTR